MPDTAARAAAPFRRFADTLRREGVGGVAARMLLHGMIAVACLLDLAGRLLREDADGRCADMAGWIRSFVFTMRIRLNSRRDSKSGGPATFSAFDIDAWKRSDTVFILGSGASINALRDEDWREVARHNSIGFNFWFIHPFVPDMYVFEMRDDNPERAEIFREIARIRSGAYARTPVVHHTLARDSREGLPGAFATNLHVLSAFRVHESMRALRRSLRVARLASRIKRWRMEAIVTPGAQLATIACLCVLAGFRNIVLLGVDLSDTRFFWETQPERYGDVPHPPNIEAGRVHATFDRARDGIPIDTYLALLREEFRKDRAFTIYCGSPASALASDFPVFRFESDRREGTA